MNLANVVRYWARWNRGGIAIRFAGRDVTYSGLNDATNRLANGLAELGVHKGDRVGILATNCIEYCETVVACLKGGAIIVPLNIRLVAKELEYIVKNADCRAVVVHSNLLPRIEEIGDGISEVKVIDIGNSNAGKTIPFESLRDHDAVDPRVEIDEKEVAFICYTSGTTGLPKGAMLSHRNVWAQAVQRNLAEGWTYEDRIYLPFPLAFTGGMITVWMPAYITGAKMVLDNAFDPKRALNTIQEERITIFAAVPVIWEAMAQQPEFEHFDLSSLRCCAAGGAPVPERLIEIFQKRGLPLSQAYGLTEGSGLNTMLRSEDALARLGFAGLPSMQEACKVVHADGGLCGPGEVGELLIKGDEVMVGYWKNPAATAEALEDGWLHTGDLALMDKDGYIKIVDRAKDMLISGGLNVYPAEIERILASFPGVKEVAVFGVPDKKWGEVPAAVIHCAGHSLDEESIIEHCKEYLADYKIPRFILFHKEELPRSMSGKILKRELRKAYFDMP